MLFAQTVLDGMLPTFFLSLLLAWWFGQVFTGGHGRGRAIWFVICPSYWCGSCLGRDSPLRCSCGGGGKVSTSPLDATVDSDVADESKRCLAGGPDMAAVVCRNLYKTYGKFNANDGLCVSMQSNQIFALLGHNGAGKTTAIHCMTALSAPTAGTIDVNGFDVATQTSQVRASIGVCPQHDVLWGNLSSREHLIIFSLLKGTMPSQQATQEIDDLLEGVKLSSVQHKFAGEYSGGMRRRLSVALASVGSPRVMFLDEPTTGMDPMSRQHVWDMIQRLKKNRSIILTTHSMEEADALGDRIGIMSHGKLVAVGSALHLKAKYGAGYRVKIVTPGPEDAKAMVRSIVGEDAELLDGSAGSLSYGIPPSALPKLPDLIEWIEGDRSGIVTDFGISHTTLEEVFIRLARPTTEVVAVAESAVTVDANAADAKGGDGGVGVGADPGTATATATAMAVANAAAVPVAGNEVAGGDYTGAIGTQASDVDKARALCYQRVVQRGQHKCYNICMCLCPAITMGLLLLANWGLDQIIVNQQLQQQESLKNNQETCGNCHAAAKLACGACALTPAQQSAQYEPRLLDTCTDNDNLPCNAEHSWFSPECSPRVDSFTYQEINSYGGGSNDPTALNSYNDQTLTRCFACRYCKNVRESFAARNVPLVYNASDWSKWDFNFNNTFYVFNDMQGAQLPMRGCEAIEEYACGGAGAVPGYCASCEGNLWDKLVDTGFGNGGAQGMCGRACEAYYTAISTEMTTDPAYTPYNKLIPQRQENRFWSNDGTTPETQSLQIAVVAENDDVADALGTRPGGLVAEHSYAEVPVYGPMISCGQNQNGYGDSSVCPGSELEVLNATVWAGILADATSKFPGTTGFLSQLPQGILVRANLDTPVLQKECKVQYVDQDGNKGGWIWKDCPASEVCQCQEHINPASIGEIPPDSQQPPSFRCLDTACGVPYTGTCPFTAGEEGCPVKECYTDPYSDFNKGPGSINNPCEPVPDYESAQCRVKASFPQRYYASPNYQKYASSSALNSAIWNAQSDQNKFASEQKIEFSGSQVGAPAFTHHQKSRISAFCTLAKSLTFHPFFFFLSPIAIQYAHEHTHEHT